MLLDLVLPLNFSLALLCTFFSLILQPFHLFRNLWTKLSYGSYWTVSPTYSPILQRSFFVYFLRGTCFSIFRSCCQFRNIIEIFSVNVSVLVWSSCSEFFLVNFCFLITLSLFKKIVFSEGAELLFFSDTPVCCKLSLNIE